MTFDLTWSYARDAVMIGIASGSSDAREKVLREFGRDMKCKKSDLFDTMSKIADFVENEIGEECLFDVW
jgi:hypothetical protein